MNLKDFWTRLSHLKQHWIINVCIGVVIELLLHGAHLLQMPGLESAQNIALDAMMRGSAATVQQDDGKTVPPLAFIDVDSRTWRDAGWGGGEPDRAPRVPLFKLIDFAFQRGASQVVLDIVVEGRKDDGADQGFADSLAGLGALKDAKVPRKLILVRTIRQPLAAGDGTGDGVPELRASALDPLIGSSGGRIGIAAPYFKQSADRILRDWHLWSLACRQGGDGKSAWVLVPSVQLLVAANQLKWPMADAPWEKAPTIPCEASSAGEGKPEALERAATAWLARVSGREIEGAEHGAPEGGISNRIVFRIGDPPGTADTPARATQVISALDILQGQETRRDLSNSIVVIGQSYPEAGDRHATPLGDMAGSLVIVNSIDSMLRHGLLQEPSPARKLAVAFALIVLVGFIFARWDSRKGNIIALTIVLVGMTLASYHYFKFGVWLDFAVPLIGIQLHRMVKRHEEDLEHQRLAKLYAGTEHH